MQEKTQLEQNLTAAKDAAQKASEDAAQLYAALEKEKVAKEQALASKEQDLAQAVAAKEAVEKDYAMAKEAAHNAAEEAARIAGKEQDLAKEITPLRRAGKGENSQGASVSRYRARLAQTIAAKEAVEKDYRWRRKQPIKQQKKQHA